MNEWLCQVTLENSASNKTVVDIFLFDQCSILTQTNLNITQLSSLFLSVLSVYCVRELTIIILIWQIRKADKIFINIWMQIYNHQVLNVALKFKF